AEAMTKLFRIRMRLSFRMEVEPRREQHLTIERCGKFFKNSSERHEPGEAPGLGDGGLLSSRRDLGGKARAGSRLGATREDARQCRCFGVDGERSQALDEDTAAAPRGVPAVSRNRRVVNAPQAGGLSRRCDVGAAPVAGR